MDESIVSDVAVPQVHVELPEALREPTRAKSLLFLLLYTVASMVIGVANITIGSILLAEHIAAIGSKDQTSIFSLLLAVGAVAAVLTNPLAGMFGDRTTSRLGRRRPWLIAGGLLTVVDLLLMSIAHSLLLVAIGYIVLNVGINMIDQSLSAIVPDQVPVRQRATISGLSGGLGTILGGIIGITLVSQFFTAIQAASTVLAIVVAIMVGAFLLILRDVPLPREYVPPFHIKKVVTAYWLNPIVHRDFALVWVARCLMFLAYTTVVAFMFYFLQDAVHYAQVFPGQTTAQGVNMFFTINGITIIIASLVGCIISDSLHLPKLFA